MWNLLNWNKNKMTPWSYWSQGYFMNCPPVHPKGASLMVHGPPNGFLTPTPMKNPSELTKLSFVQWVLGSCLLILLLKFPNGLGELWEKNVFFFFFLINFWPYSPFRRWRSVGFCGETTGDIILSVNSDSWFCFPHPILKTPRTAGTVWGSCSVIHLLEVLGARW